MKLRCADPRSALRRLVRVVVGVELLGVVRVPDRFKEPRNTVEDPKNTVKPILSKHSFETS